MKLSTQNLGIYLLFTMSENYEIIHPEEDESWLADGESIICRHCKLVSYIEFNRDVEEEIVDFSHYDFAAHSGFVLWICRFIEDGEDQLHIHDDVIISSHVLDNGYAKFNWWPAEGIKIYKE